jgi:uncharacterized phage infection (PIP) family protein YhgE
MKRKKVTPEIRKRIFELNDSDLKLKIGTIAFEVGLSERAVRNKLRQGYTSTMFNKIMEDPPNIVVLRREKKPSTPGYIHDSTPYNQPVQPDPKIKQLEDENIRLKKDIATLNQKLTQVESERNHLKGQVGELRRTVDQKNTEYITLISKYDQTKNELDIITNKLDITEDKVEQLKTHIDQLVSDQKKTQDDHKILLNIKDKRINSLNNLVTEWIYYAIPLMVRDKLRA